MHGKKLGARLLGGFVVLVLIIFVINQPSQAATVTSTLFDWFGHAGNAVSTFLGTVLG